MAAIDFPTATSNGQTFEADSGVIYTYVGTPPNGFWSGTFGTTGLNTLDGRYIAKNDGNTLQTIQTQGLKFNSGSSDTILLDGINGKIGIGTSSPSNKLDVLSTTAGTTVNVRVGSTAVSGVNNANLIINNGGTGDATLRFDYESNTNRASIGINASTQALIFKTAGDNERLRIDSSGRVGIGDSTPSEKLNVAGNVMLNGSDQFIYLTNAGTGNSGIYVRGNTSGSYLRSHSTGIFTWEVTGSEKMRIDSSGQVGIGTTSPGQRLTVATSSGNCYIEAKRASKSTGQVALALRGGTSGADCILYQNTNSDDLRFYVSGSDRAVIDSSGNAGIGTTSPNSPGSYTKTLEVSDGNSASVVLSRTNSTAHSLEIGVFSGASLIESTGATSLRFKTNSSERLRIDSSGNVGIGTSSPSSLLECNDSANDIQARFGSLTAGIDPTIRLQGKNAANTTNCFTDIKLDAENQVLLLADPGTSSSSIGNSPVAISSSGSVGIGTTSPSRKLVVSSAGAEGIEFSPGESANANLSLHFNRNSNIYITNEVRAADHIFSIGSNEKARIDSSGRLLLNGGTDVRIELGTTGTTGTNNRNHLRGDGANLKYNTASGGVHVFEQNGSEAMQIDSSGRLLVGTGSTSVAGTAVFQGSSQSSNTNAVVKLACDSTAPGNGGNLAFLMFTDGTHVDGARIYAQRDGGTWSSSSKPTRLVFGTAADGSSSPTERMKIDSSGRTIFANNTGSQAFPSATSFINDAGFGQLLAFNNTYGGGKGYVTFYYNSTQVGSIVASGSAGSTATGVSYNTTSDYRLKENVVDITDGITRVKLLQPKRFNFIADADTTVDGFLAHEAQAVVPEAVNGTHNQVDDDGNPVMQGIDQAKLVPLLTAALQEAIAKIETLETKVAALEAA